VYGWCDVGGFDVEYVGVYEVVEVFVGVEGFD